MSNRSETEKAWRELSGMRRLTPAGKDVGALEAGREIRAKALKITNFVEEKRRRRTLFPGDVGKPFRRQKPICQQKPPFFCWQTRALSPGAARAEEPPHTGRHAIYEKRKLYHKSFRRPAPLPPPLEP